MTDGETLYVVLLALYLLEGLAWVPRGSIALRARKSNWALPRLPHRTIGNARGGAVLGFPFLSEATVFVIPQWPVSFSPDGVLFWVSESLEQEERAQHSGLHFHFDSISKVSTDGRDVTIDGEHALETASSWRARKVAEVIRRLRRLARDERAAAIDAFLDELVDVDGAKTRIEVFYQETSKLRTASFVLWVVTLVIVPAMAARFGLERVWIIALLLVYVPTWVTAALWVRAHRKFFPFDRLERWGYAALLALVPVSGMRAIDLLARRILHGFHPIAAVAAMAPKDRVERFLAHLLRDAHFPMLPTSPTEDAEIRETEEFYRNAMQKRLTTLARTLSFNPDELVALPIASGDIDGEKCCPRCHARYATDTRACEDCGGIALELSRVVNEV